MVKKRKSKYRPPPTEEEIQKRQETQEEDLRRNIKKLVNTIAKHSRCGHIEVWQKLKSQFNGESVTTTSIQGLIEREKVLTEWEDELITELAQQHLYRIIAELSE